MKKVFSLLLALMLVFSLAVTAFAVEDDITYKGKESFVILPGANAYTDTDMFANMKNAMPGDVLYEEVKIVNASYESDYVLIYFQAIPHSASSNMPSKSILAAGETLESMNDFLQQLHMEIKVDGEVIFSGTPNSGTDEIYLTRLNRFKSLELDVTVTVPKHLGNEYAYREGEVDWQFTFQQGDYPSDTPKTGDYIMGAAAVMLLSAAALTVLLILKKKKKSN